MGARALRIAAWSVVALAVVYLVLANLILLLPLGRSLVSSDRVEVDYDVAYSVLPTRVHARGLEVRVTGTDARWVVTAARADARVAPLALFAGRLHARRLDVTGVRVLVEEHERDAPGEPAERTASAPALVVPDPAGTEADAEPRARWTLRVDDLQADDVRELAVGDVVFEGAARVRGALRYGRDAGVRIDDARVDVLSGALRHGDHPVVQNLGGRVELRRHAVTTDARAAVAWLSRLDGDVELSGAVPSVNPLLGARPADYRGSGAVRASLRVEDGALASGSTLEMHAPPTVLDGAPGRARFSGDLALAVGAGGAATLRGTLRDVTLAERDPDAGEQAALVVPELQIDGDARVVRLAAPLEHANVAVTAPELSGDLSALPVLRTLADGAAQTSRGSAELVVADGEARGRIEARAEGVELVLGDHAMVGAVDLGAELVGWEVGSDEARVRARVEYAGQGTTASLAMREAVYDLARESIRGRASLRMSSALPALDALTGAAALPTLIAVIASDQALEGTADVVVAERRASVEEIDASAGPLHVQGAYSVDDGRRRATLLLETGPFAVGVGVRGVETSFILVGARSWFEEARAGRAP